MRQHPLERTALIAQVARYLSQDGNLWLLGVPGSGRREFIEHATGSIQGIILYLDCLRTTDQERFVALLAQSFLTGFADHTEGLAWVRDHLDQYRVHIDPRSRQLSLTCLQPQTLDQDLGVLLTLPQHLAEVHQRRVIVFLNNFIHLNSWDRNETWQRQIRQKLDLLPDANYVLGYGLGNAPPMPETQATDFQVLQLMPLAPALVQNWFDQNFALTAGALSLLVETVQGHWATALAFARRLDPVQTNNETHVQKILTDLLADLFPTLETLLRQLPAIQCRVLETLALDPTPHPQSNDYTRRHGLPRGGSLQGALTALVKKDLLYSPDVLLASERTAKPYQFCQPLMGLWIRRYLA